METINKTGNPVIAQEIIAAIQEVYDPELPVNVYDLGLIYRIEITENLEVEILMTLTSPNCPEAESIPLKVQQAVTAVKGIISVSVSLTFEPTWNADMLSDEAKLEMGLF